jgi:acetyl-CoA/propionyl-CoA carboxylase biotin carboxyl carrier protein
MSEPRILIANRGEIAVRIMRSCRELGDARRLGPASPAQSYLNVDAILDAAVAAKATHVHPGYGFLAENADFARAIGSAGLTFVGPPPEAMEMMGDKAAARRAAERVGVPIVPGTTDPVDADDATRESERIGFPLAVKAAFGGGGKGMRVVGSKDELRSAMERAAREAGAYFSRPEVYLERYLERAHHVEAQILADTHGGFSFLGERDCSLQRRYQKLVEESPSPVVDQDLRARIGEAALALAKEAGYQNAGTVEFLVDDDGNFYFLEVNARLQVEHPVTEFVTGLDLVALQLRVALGERVEVEPRAQGHAIECRINAEDPYRDFLPGPGVVTGYQEPGGPFVRVDAGVRAGKAIPGEYDSLFAKLIVWAEDRERARRRMLRALEEYRVEGVPTTIPFHRWVLETPEFREGTHWTKLVESALAETELPRFEEMPMGRGLSSSSAARPETIVVEVEGRRVPVRIFDESIRAAPRPPAHGGHTGGGHGGGDVVTAPMQGTILQVMVEEGQQLSAGDVICILEAMKMENHIAAPRDGRVAELPVEAGQVVETNQTIAVIN